MAGEGYSESKVCSKCGEVKPLAEFNRNGPSPDGVRPDCRECQKTRARAYVASHREEHRESGRRDYAKNKAARNAKNQLWIASNREAAKAIQRKAARKRNATPKGKITAAIKAGLYQAVRKGSKSGRRTYELLGYTHEALMAHLEDRFLPGMTWDNYGRNGWHVDHIIPISAFNYETPDDIDFKKAWALNNLQPLWEFDNLSKHAKLNRPFQPSLLLGEGVL